MNRNLQIPLVVTKLMALIHKHPACQASASTLQLTLAQVQQRKGRDKASSYSAFLISPTLTSDILGLEIGLSFSVTGQSVKIIRKAHY